MTPACPPACLRTDSLFFYGCAQVLLEPLPGLMGSVVDVEITGAGRWSMTGHVAAWVHRCPSSSTGDSAGDRDSGAASCGDSNSNSGATVDADVSATVVELDSGPSKERGALLKGEVPEARAAAVVAAQEACGTCGLVGGACSGSGGGAEASASSCQDGSCGDSSCGCTSSAADPQLAAAALLADSAPAAGASSLIPSATEAAAASACSQQAEASSSHSSSAAVGGGLVDGLLKLGVLVGLLGVLLAGLLQLLHSSSSAQLGGGPAAEAHHVHDAPPPNS